MTPRSRNARKPMVCARTVEPRAVFAGMYCPPYVSAAPAMITARPARAHSVVSASATVPAMPTRVRMIPATVQRDRTVSGRRANHPVVDGGDPVQRDDLGFEAFGEDAFNVVAEHVLG